jgi:serine/threonine-protein kinase
MATVVLAEDKVLGREVALKRVATEGDVRSLSRLRREALVGASLSHRNLVAVYDVITTDSGDAVIVMEFVPGETLGERIGREGRLAPAEALSILAGVAAGLDAIHSRGIVHRDVKPANILLGPEGAVKLADLGIAAAADRTQITTAGTVLGSFRYMAPEQMEGASATPAVDVYGLAAVAFEALSGKSARDEPNPIALAHAIATRPPPDLQDAWPEAPAAAAELLSRGMSRDPAARPRSAGELIARLRAALDPQVTVGVVPSPQRTVDGPVPSEAVPSLAPLLSAPAERPRRVSVPRRSPPRRAVQPTPASATQERPHTVAGGTGSPGATRGRVLPVLFLLLIVAGVAIVLALHGGGSHAPGSVAATAHHRSHPTRNATGHGTSSPETGSSTGSGAASGSAASGSAASGSAAGDSAPPASSRPATSAPGGSSSPVSAVESFYHLAASHNYAAAWTLADPTFRAQLEGYDSFQAGQSGDESITFHQTRVISQGSTDATVAVSTTSVRTDGTKQCSGTVDLVHGGSGWLLHQIHINCA